MQGYFLLKSEKDRWELVDDFCQVVELKIASQSHIANKRCLKPIKPLIANVSSGHSAEGGCRGQGQALL